MTSASAHQPQPGGAADLPQDRPRGVFRKVWSGFLSYGVVILCLVFLFTKLGGSDDLSEALQMISAPQVVIICILGVINLATNLPPMMVALPGLRFREAAVTNTASAALSNTVPEGGAIATGLNYAMLRSWGFALDDITSEVLITGVWSQMTKYGIFCVAAVGVVVVGPAPSGTVWFAVLLIALVLLAAVVLALVLRSTRFASNLGRWLDDLGRGITRLFHRWLHGVHLPSMQDELPKFRLVLVTQLVRCWGRLTVAEVCSQLTACIVLGISCRMMGLDDSTISWWTIVVAYSAVTLASLLIPTPGGLGVAEVVLVAVLGYGLPASDQPAILAAVILFRIATFLLPIPIGLGTYLYWRRSKAWRRPVDSRRVSYSATATKRNLQ